MCDRLASTSLRSTSGSVIQGSTDSGITIHSRIHISIIHEFAKTRFSKLDMNLIPLFSLIDRANVKFSDCKAELEGGGGDNLLSRKFGTFMFVLKSHYLRENLLREEGAKR